MVDRVFQEAVVVVHRIVIESNRSAIYLPLLFLCRIKLYSHTISLYSRWLLLRLNSLLLSPSLHMRSSPGRAVNNRIS